MMQAHAYAHFITFVCKYADMLTQTVATGER